MAKNSTPQVNGQKIIGEFNSWEGFRDALRKRWNERGYAIEDANDKIGLPARYLNRLLAPNDAGYDQAKQITWNTFLPIMLGFGVKCLLVEDAEAIERYEKHIRRRNGKLVRPSRTHYAMTDRRWARIRKLGSKKRWAGTTKEQRSAAARHAALIRWNDVKEAAACAVAKKRRTGNGKDERN